MTQPRRALIVEDEMMIALTIEDILIELGYEVCGIATTLEKALQAAAELTMDVAILDVNLNGRYSLPVADCLHARGIPFIFQTGYGAQGIDVSRFNAPVVSKPFTAEDVRQALQAANVLV